MTRQELAEILLADKDKLQEEVRYYDSEYDRLYGIAEIKSIKVDIKDNGDVIQAIPEKYTAFRRHVVETKQMTMIW